jgi:hypothetical protein
MTCGWELSYALMTSDWGLEGVILPRAVYIVLFIGKPLSLKSCVSTEEHGKQAYTIPMLLATSREHDNRT